MANPGVHNIGMALTPNFGLVVHDRVPSPSPPQQGMVGSGRWTENRPLSLSFRLNPWPSSRGLTHLQVWNGQHGSEEVASGLSASHFQDRTPTSISPLSPSPSHSATLSGSGIVEGIQLSPLINHLCLHCSDVIDRHTPKYA